jgi:hypothetical protein
MQGIDRRWLVAGAAAGLALLVVVGVVVAASVAVASPLFMRPGFAPSISAGPVASAAAKVGAGRMVDGVTTLAVIRAGRAAGSARDAAAAKAGRTPRTLPTAANGRDIAAYAGFGAWVDIWDDKAWAAPEAAVADMAAHGVKTLYIETANSRSKSAFVHPAALRRFVVAAHARKMKVVAWYLPDLLDLNKDYDRIAAAIRYTTPEGQRFDSFALDIESSKVAGAPARNRALETLSRRIRAAAGPRYPLGAITPSPVGMAKNTGYWPGFPWRMLAGVYDVFVPMGYYTYHVKGYGPAYAESVQNMRIVRAQPGCASVPIHLIGGITDKSTGAEVAAFVRATREERAFGASLYAWAGTTAAMWREMERGWR